MKLIVQILLTVVGVITTIGGLFQGYVALMDILKRHQGLSGLTKRLFIILICVVIAIASLYGILDQSPGTPPSTSTPTVVPTLRPTATPTMQITPTDTPLPTDTPSPVPTLSPTPGLATRAATSLPFVIDCGCSYHPVQVRVTRVQINQSLGFMTWDLTLINVGSTQVKPIFSSLDIYPNEQPSLLTNAEGGVADVNSNLTLAPYGQKGYIGYSTIKFPVVPQQGTYMISGFLSMCLGGCDSIHYDGVPFSFQ